MSCNEYICPHCFAVKDKNDVLFRRNIEGRQPDPRKQFFWSAMHPGQAAPAHCQMLAEWRSYPQSQRLLQEDTVVGILDYNRDRLLQRVCKECHYPDVLKNNQGLILLPWKNRHVDIKQGRALMNALGQGQAPWTLLELSAEKDTVLMPYLVAESPENHSLWLPLGLFEKDKILDAGIFKRYLSVCNATVLWLELEPLQGKQTVPDLDAIREVLDFTETYGGRGDPTLRPTAVMVSTADKAPDDPVLLNQWLQTHHCNLCNALESTFTLHSVTLWRQPELAAKIAADWLLKVSFEGQTADWPRQAPAAPTQPVAEPVPAAAEPVPAAAESAQAAAEPVPAAAESAQPAAEPVPAAAESVQTAAEPVQPSESQP